MHTSSRIGLTALLAAMMLFSALATSSARNLSISESSTRATWSSLEFSGSGITIRCHVTLESSAHTGTMSKVVGTLVGGDYEARFGHPCTGGEAWADNGRESEPLGTATNTLPWHWTYHSFVGTLPAIDGVKEDISRASWVIQASVLGLTCRGRYFRAEDNVDFDAVRESSGGITSLATDEIDTVSLVQQLGPNAVCPSTERIIGTGNETERGNGARETITLI